MFIGHGPEFGRGVIGPGQELVEPALGMAVDDAADDVGEIAIGLGADEFAGLNERSDHGPMLGAGADATPEKSAYGWLGDQDSNLD